MFPQAVRQYDGYRIDAFDVKNQTLVARPNSDEEFLRKYDTDRRSVFIGGLPVDTTREDLIELCSPVAEVINANVVPHANPHSQSIPLLAAFAKKLLTENVVVNPRNFGFVEFARADIPDLVVASLVSTRPPNMRGWSDWSLTGFAALRTTLSSADLP